MLIPIKTICEQIRTALATHDYEVGDLVYHKAISYKGMEWVDKVMKINGTELTVVFMGVMKDKIFNPSFGNMIFTLDANSDKISKKSRFE